MINRWRSFFALVLALVMTSACSQGVESPTEPTPVPTPPVQSFVSIAVFFPEPGATLRALRILPNGYNDGDYLRVGVRYGISEEHSAEAGRTGDRIVVRTCLSVDGVTSVSGGCYGNLVSSVTGTYISNHTLVMYRNNPRVTKTNFILVSMEWLPREEGIGRIFLIQKFDGVFFWDHDWGF